MNSLEDFATYYKSNQGQPIDNLAYMLDSKGQPLKGNPFFPFFKNVKNESGDPEKINYLPWIIQSEYWETTVIIRLQTKNSEV